MVITDFHTHAFPDSLADHAIRALEHGADEAKARLDGRVSSLVASMDRAGIGRSVICSIATRPEQFGSILKWSGTIRSDQIVPLASIHPADPDPTAKIARIAESGFMGIKMHPYYQDFFLDEDRMLPFYREMERRGLILVMHTGFDMAFARIRRADPERILKVIRQFPELKLVTSHLGSWEDWDHVQAHLIGRPIYIESSYSLKFMTREKARDLIMAHPPEFLLFGTDSPWGDQSEDLARLRGLGLGESIENAMLCGNADRLLNSVPRASAGGSRPSEPGING